MPSLKSGTLRDKVHSWLLTNESNDKLNKSIYVAFQNNSGLTGKKVYVEPGVHDERKVKSVFLSMRPSIIILNTVRRVSTAKILRKYSSISFNPFDQFENFSFSIQNSFQFNSIQFPSGKFRLA